MGTCAPVISAFAAAIAQKEMMEREIPALPAKAKPARPVALGKCQSCGSREYQNHHGKHICSFCRNEATYDQD